MTEDTAQSGPEAPVAGDPGARARRRTASDRRRRPTGRLSRYALWGGQRRSVRRAAEREGSFVDQYSSRLWFMVLWIGLLNAADSFFTIVHLQRGGVELNPLAAMLLELGRTGFVLSKSVLIAVPLIVLCVHKNFRLARTGLWTAAITYTALLGYHLSLF